jgi:hypothetical protein
MTVFYPVFQVAELAAGYRYTAAFTKMPASHSDATHHCYFLQSCTFHLGFEARSCTRGIMIDSRW